MEGVHVADKQTWWEDKGRVKKSRVPARACGMLQFWPALHTHRETFQWGGDSGRENTISH